MCKSHHVESSYVKADDHVDDADDENRDDDSDHRLCVQIYELCLKW